MDERVLTYPSLAQTTDAADDLITDSDLARYPTLTPAAGVPSYSRPPPPMDDRLLVPASLPEPAPTAAVDETEGDVARETSAPQRTESASRPPPMDDRLWIGTLPAADYSPMPKSRPIWDLVGDAPLVAAERLPKPKPDIYRANDPRPRLLSAADYALYVKALKETRNRHYRRAMSIAKKAKDPLPAKVIAWTWMTDRDSDAPFATVRDFMAANPHWPGLSRLQTRAEKAINDKVSDADALAWFTQRPPKTGPGMRRYGEILLRSGDQEAGREWIKRAWIEGNFPRRDESLFYRQHKHLIDPQDNVARLDRLIWDRQRSASARMLRRVDKRTKLLAEARMKLMNSAGGVDAAIEKVPADLQADPGLIYERIRWRRQRRMHNGAQELLLATPAEEVRPDKWWRERRIQVRKLLLMGHISDAYRMASSHHLTPGRYLAEAEFLSGWIALRFLSEAEVALRHFRRLYENVSFPVSRARGAYWAARAAEAQNMPLVAVTWYRQAAEHPTTYYGQLAFLQLGWGDAFELPEPVPEPTEAELAAFEDRELVRIIRRLTELDVEERVKPFIQRLVDLSETPTEHLMVAQLAGELALPHMAVMSSKRSARRGVILVNESYPEIPVLRQVNPAAELSLVHALARQESEFNPKARSRVGARGLMQLMPATAKRVARSLRVGYRRDRLLTDPYYNARLGSHYLNGLVERYDGSYALALAAYNAGEGRVRRWIRDWGDPRTGEIDPVDWVELIPFTETRNYVQRVLEGVQIYRHRLSETRGMPLSLAEDLTGRRQIGMADGCEGSLIPPDGSPMSDDCDDGTGSASY